MSLYHIVMTVQKSCDKNVKRLKITFLMSLILILKGCNLNSKETCEPQFKGQKSLAIAVTFG